MPAAPVWLSAITVAHSVLCLLTAWWLMRGRAAALTAFVLASLASAVATVPALLVLLSARSATMLMAFGNFALHMTAPSERPHQLLLAILFGVLYPLIIGTCIALLVRRNDPAKVQG
jgi:hypothetical protein